jgi:hypothetical protein
LIISDKASFFGVTPSSGMLTEMGRVLT